MGFLSALLLSTIFGGGTHHTGTDDSVLAAPEFTRQTTPIECSSPFGGRLEWAVMEVESDSRRLRAAIDSNHQAGLARARTVCVEGLDETGTVIWKCESRLVTRPVARRGRPKRQATLTCAIPLRESEKSLRIRIN